jgi:ADP-L-glycero-D-manno-heptose 6-epimerase
MPSLHQGRILVTGGAGFIGSALIWALNQRGITNIFVTDFLGTDEKWKNLVPLKFGEYVEADMFRNRIRENNRFYGEFHYVFHLGANSSTTEKNAAHLIDNNYTYTCELCTWALTQRARFLYASSAATYGDGAQGMDDKDDNLNRLRPLNMYGYSKHLFDLWAQRQGVIDRIVGVKYFNVFGPNEDHKGDMRSLVNKAYRQILATGRVQLFKSYKPEFKDGEQKRDFLYVKDAVEMTLSLVTSLRTSGLYNLGSGGAHTWLDLTRAIFAALDRPPLIDFIEMPAELRGKYQYFTQADIGKLRTIGYAAATTPLADAVRDYVQNYLVPDRRLG